jgi:hypothetical protein
MALNTPLVATNTAPTGTENTAVTRPIFRKFQYLETNQLLGANAGFTGSWHDTTLTGGNYVMATSVANVAAVSNGFQIQESEDLTNTRVVASLGANSTLRAYGFIRARYWRVVYTNGAVAQTSFSLYATESSLPIMGTGPSNAQVEPIMISAGQAAGNPADGLSPASFSQILTTAGSGGLQSNALWKFNGTTFDRERNNATGTTGDTPTIVNTTPVNGATQTNFNARGAIITAILGTVTGTSPTLLLQLQWSPDGGTTWLNYGPATSAVSVATGNTVAVGIYPTNFSTAGATPGAFVVGATGSVFMNAPMPRTWRMVYTGGGSTISIAIASVQINYIV